MVMKVVKAVLAVLAGAFLVKFFEFLLQGYLMDPLILSMFFGAFAVGYLCGLGKKGSVLLGLSMSYPVFLELPLREYTQMNVGTFIVSVLLLIAYISVVTAPFAYLGYLTKGHISTHGFLKTLKDFLSYIKRPDAGTRAGLFIGLIFGVVSIFIGGDYYYVYFYDKINMMSLYISGGGFVKANLQFIVGSIYFVWIMFWCTFWGKLYQHFHPHLPTRSPWIKGLSYGIIVWTAMGFLFLFFFFRKSFMYAFDIFQWLIYGLFLGKFYDAFSKEPDAGIFYMLKKTALRK